MYVKIVFILDGFAAILALRKLCKLPFLVRRPSVKILVWIVSYNKHLHSHPKYFEQIKLLFGQFIGLCCVYQMGYDFHCPAVAKHLVCLRIGYGEFIPFRHCLKPFAFAHCQLADDVEAISKLNWILLALDGDEAVLDLIDRVCLAVRAGDVFP